VTVLGPAVALSVYNRPDTTASVLAAIERVRPRQLFIFADGPATAADTETCEQARAVVERLNWECDAHRDYSEDNLGAKFRYASGVSWVLSHVDEAIILDDDCVPDPSFFHFCEAMLERYRDDTRVMMVSGSNYLEHWKADRQSYHFSLFGSVWGWATWKRAWDLYDITLAAWADDHVKGQIRELISDDEIYAIQARRFDNLYANPGDRYSWDLPWSLTRLVHAGLTIVPAVNTVSNHGNKDGRGIPVQHPLAQLPATPLPFPLVDPPAVTADRAYDRLHVRRIFDWWDTQARRQRDERMKSRALHRRVLRRLHRAPHLVSKRAP
jgi:hypothetical protein